MRPQLRVTVFASDPISEAGIAAEIRRRPHIRVVEELALDSADVAVIVAEQVDDETVRMIRSVQRNGGPPVAVVMSHLDEQALLRAIEAGASAFLRRSEATPEALEAAIESAAVGDGRVPADLLGRLLGQVGQLQREVLSPRGLTFSGLTDREVDVLRLVADGHDTSEIASNLCYSERTVKNVIHDVTSRFNLKNRSHAVAYAVREGLI